MWEVRHVQPDDFVLGGRERGERNRDVLRSSLTFALAAVPGTRRHARGRNPNRSSSTMLGGTSHERGIRQETWEEVCGNTSSYYTSLLFGLALLSSCSLLQAISTQLKLLSLQASAPRSFVESEGAILVRERASQDQCRNRRCSQLGFQQA